MTCSESPDEKRMGEASAVVLRRDSFALGVPVRLSHGAFVFSYCSPRFFCVLGAHMERGSLMKNQKNRSQSLRTMVLVAVFCAVSYVCQFLFRIHVGFLTFDAKDAVMTVGAMLFGAPWGIVMALLVSFLEMITISETGWIGFFMNFISSAAFAGFAALIYRRKKTVTGAILGLSAGVITMTGLMILWNLLMTPLYMKTDIGVVIAMIPTLLLPFNLTKALLNAGLVLIFYKPISTALKKAKLIRGEVGTLHFSKKTLLMLLLGLLLIAACIVVFVVAMHGSLEWGYAAS